MVNPIDAGIISYLNHFAHRSFALDDFFVLCSNYLLRAAGIVPLYWWAWFSRDDDNENKRDVLIFGLVGCMFAFFLARLISMVVPFRARPIHDPALHFQAPFGQGTQMLLGWSAFPSDHAAVYFTLAACLFLVSRRLGWFALCWAFFITCLPRVYLGMHYPSDILAGALLGFAVASLARFVAFRKTVTAPLRRWENRFPGPFYALLFLFSLQVATAFEPVLLFRDYFRAVFGHAAKLLS